MSNTIGRFEILSEVTSSEMGSVYKASDPESGQTIALKTIRPEMLAEQAETFVRQILQEVEHAKVLNSHNLAQVYGAELLDGQFCAALEYVQGNSVATMLARREGFSIWDIQDIARQTCQGLDHAHVRHVVHYSLEPAKIMVTWDGTVKILGFGISAMGAYACQASGKAPEVLHYMTPEQLQGEVADARSNLFSLGAILYEMVTEFKAFGGEDADQVRKQILDQMPPAPDTINRKIHPALNDLIMKALAKSPEERYQSGQDLINDLEKCKESSTKATAAKKPQPPQPSNAPPHEDPAAAGGASPLAQKAQPAPETRTMAPPSIGRAAKAAAAAAGWSAAGSNPTSVDAGSAQQGVPATEPADMRMTTSVDALPQPQAAMSAVQTEPETEAPAFAVDPMMSGSAKAAAAGPSFSQIDALPPLKKVHVAPPPPVELETPAETKATLYQPPAQVEKPKLQPSQLAKKAVTEIKKTPPKLFLYSIAAALGIILLVVVVIAFRIRSENPDEEGAAARPSPVSATATRQETAKPPVPLSRAAASQAPAQRAVVPEHLQVEASDISVTPKYNSKHRAKSPAPAPAPAVIPGQLTINSTPEGAQVLVDGRSDPNWVTPFNMTGLVPGQHSVSISKPGYSSESRSIEVASNSKSFLVIQLAQQGATATVNSDPAGAAVIVDGKDSGRVTPAQVTLEKSGSHTILLKKQGYLEETITANLQPGQIFHFAPTLRALGETDEIRLGGKFKKMFGGRETSGMGRVSVKTQPKGAQVAVNNRIVDKPSPVEFYLNPGTYVIDVTISGFKTIHRVINVDKGGKVSIDENMTPE